MAAESSSISRALKRSAMLAKSLDRTRPLWHAPAGKARADARGGVAKHQEGLAPGAYALERLPFTHSDG